MANLFIEPSDVWLFRDGRPFAQGGIGRAVSQFPPTPQTMQGVIRSARLGQSGEPFDAGKWSTPLRQEIGQPDDFGRLRLRGPLVAQRVGAGLQRLFPWPRDVIRSQSGWQILAPTAAPSLVANWPRDGLQSLLPSAASDPTRFEPGWIGEAGFLAYLAGQPGGIPDRESHAVYEREPRLGIQIDSPAKRTEPGMLYQVEFIRPAPEVGLLVEAGGVTLARSGLVQLGGEARAGRYETVTTGVDLPQTGRLPGTPSPVRFKLYLATPTFFADGWLPAFAGTSLAGTWRGVPVRLLAAAVGRPQPIGGRDISQRDRQRPIRYAVPAGSVYYFETAAPPSQVLAAFDGQCVADAAPDAQIGYGLAYVGAW
jgi:CRISPR-associated protein Cmr3